MEFTSIEETKEWFKIIKPEMRKAHKRKEVEFFVLPLPQMNIRISVSWFVEDNTNSVRCYNDKTTKDIIFKMNQRCMERFIIATIKNPCKAKYRYRKYRIER